MPRLETRSDFAATLTLGRPPMLNRLETTGPTLPSVSTPRTETLCEPGARRMNVFGVLHVAKALRSTLHWNRTMSRSGLENLTLAVPPFTFARPTVTLGPMVSMS